MKTNTENWQCFWSRHFKEQLHIITILSTNEKIKFVCKAECLLLDQNSYNTQIKNCSVEHYKTGDAHNKWTIAKRLVIELYVDFVIWCWFFNCIHFFCDCVTTVLVVLHYYCSNTLLTLFAQLLLYFIALYIIGIFFFVNNK